MYVVSFILVPLHELLAVAFWFRAGWRKSKTKKGETLYVNDIEKITSWDPPVAIPPVATAAAAAAAPRHGSEGRPDHGKNRGTPTTVTATRGRYRGGVAQSRAPTPLAGLVGYQKMSESVKVSRWIYFVVYKTVRASAELGAWGSMLLVISGQN